MDNNRVAKLRALMQSKGWYAVVISGTDPHNDEYLPDRWQQRREFSGFTGDYGTLVITADHAGLWTDTRFFIQFFREMASTEFVLHKLRVADAVDWPEWLAQTMPKGAKVVIDGLCTPTSVAMHLKELIAEQNGEVISTDEWLNELWDNRPELPKGMIFSLDTRYSGRSREDKLRWLRAQMADKGCGATVINALDQIAWLLNIRCSDVDYNPVAIAYAIVTQNDATLFIMPEKVSREMQKELAEAGVQIDNYTNIIDAVGRLDKETWVMIDPSSMNYAVSEAVEKRCGKTVETRQPIALEKAKKNSVEIEGFRRAYIEDGVALTRFFRWLEGELAQQHKVTEWTASQHLSELRQEREGAMGESFYTISAYGENAALPHYFPTADQNATIEPRGLYLLDSGGQYLYGTTDTTRTVALGALTDPEREDYTLDLKAMIGLSTAIFPRGTRGANIDALARIALWRHYRNFGHGTGHGTGHFLCVHEGPQDLRQNLYDQTMEAGMVTSVEPGIYREGMHGVRHENVILCTDKGSNEFGDWLGFETLTCCYIDPKPLLRNLMTDEENEWLESYNRHVYHTLEELLSPEEREWLAKKIGI